MIPPSLEGIKIRIQPSQHYTSGEKPEGLVERIDDSIDQNDLLN